MVKNEPHFELKRFEEELSAVIPNGVFDWIISVWEQTITPRLSSHIKPILMMKPPSLLHPESGQIRISKTAKLIEQAKRVTYLVTGESKADILKEIQTTLAGTYCIQYKIHAKNGVTGMVFG